jgi:hypothetical protein
MKTRLFLLTLLVSVFMLSLSAKEVSMADAQKAAKNFMYITLNKFEGSATMDQVSLADPYVFSQDGKAVFYAFNLNPGFIIISAEDNFIPVIGYSYEGSFVFETADPNYKSYIQGYADHIKYVRDNQIAAQPEITAQWEELLSDNITSMTITRDRDVAPLLSSTWDQGSPYNILCPEDPAGPGGHVWVGCVATAMAQIMYYWRYPETGTSSHCYTPSPTYGQQCADFANTHYGWEGMINSIDNKNPYPNAELQYHCAVSVNMGFNPNGSGAQSYLVPNRLDAFWRYNDAEYLEKSGYSQTNWINLLKAEIDVMHPLYYSGYTTANEGHAFVCDGYQGNNFHFNFGWSGSGNGYYALTDVGGFYLGQACVRYFVPSDAAYPYINTGNVTITYKSGSFEDGSGPVENYADNLDATWLIDPQTVQDSISKITLNFVRFDLLAGDSIKVYNGGTTSAPLLGSYSGTTLPPTLNSTGNKMLIRFITNGSGNSTGWYAEFSTTSPTWCSGMTQLTEPSGNFNDGSGNFYYQGGATCMWRIKPQYANKITLYFDSFETEEGVDLLKVFDNNVLVATLSGSELPDPITVNSGTLFLTWSTNLLNHFPGWEAYYEINNVGVSENSGILSLETYPNPAGKELTVTGELKQAEPFTITLTNPAGQVVYRESRQAATQFHCTLNTSGLQSGLYFLRVTSASGSWNKKVVVAH